MLNAGSAGLDRNSSGGSVLARLMAESTQHATANLSDSLPLLSSHAKLTSETSRFSATVAYGQPHNLMYKTLFKDLHLALVWFERLLYSMYKIIVNNEVRVRFDSEIMRIPTTKYRNFETRF